MNIPSRKRPFGRSALALAALAAFAAAGCGPAHGGISGVVKYNGQPLPLGTITFLSQGGDNQTTPASIVDGKYSIPALPAGPTKVTVTSPPLPTPGASPDGAPPAPVDRSKYVKIPAKYGVPDQSGLTYEVTAGSQTKDFDLQP